MRFRILSALSFVLFAACPAPADPGPDAGSTEVPEPPFHTPAWAFEPWISKDISDRADTLAFVDGFQSRDIPVGTVVLDSPWETHYNTFVPHPVRYADFGNLVSTLKGKGVRTVLWITPLVNTTSFDLEAGGDTYAGESPNFYEGEERGYFVNDAETYEWWKGIGAAVDLFNPDARDWWHAQQDAVLDLGIAGWKLDFGEEYITTRPIRTADGPKSLQQYSEMYYRDFLAYGVQRNGSEEFVSMARPWDESYGFPGRFFAKKEHCRLGWVGDNRRDWVGLSDALDHLFRSAAAGYLVIGSDIGGYLDRDDVNLGGPVLPFDVDNFLRWTAMGALQPFMQLHGRANITPWTVPSRVDEVVTAYRYWSWFHSDLVPFLYSLAEEGVKTGLPILRPEGTPESWPGDYRWQLGEALLVAPILDATGVRDVALPAGSRWVDFWNQAADSVAGGQVLEAVDVQDPSRIPLYLREGAIVPVEVRNDVSGLGSAAQADHLSIVGWPSSNASTFPLYDTDGAVTTLGAGPTEAGVKFTWSRATRPLALRLRVEGGEPGQVKLVSNGTTIDVPKVADAFAVTTGWHWDATRRSAVVHLPASTAAGELRLLDAPR